MFSGTAFREPFKHLNEGEPPAKTRQYKDIVQGRSTNSIFKVTTSCVSESSNIMFSSEHMLCALVTVFSNYHLDSYIYSVLSDTNQAD